MIDKKNMKRGLFICFFCCVAFLVNAQSDRFVYADGRLLDCRESLWGKNGYDNKLLSINRDDGYVRRCCYDSDERLRALTYAYPGSGETLRDSLFYNDSGWVERREIWYLKDVNDWGKRYTLCYEYDGEGRVISRKTYSFSSLANEYVFSYNEYGQLVLMEMTEQLTVEMSNPPEQWRTEYTYYPDGGELACRVVYRSRLIRETPWLYQVEKAVSVWDENRHMTAVYDSVCIADGYDSLCRDSLTLQYAGREEYGYDENGNCVSVCYLDTSDLTEKREVYSIDTGLVLNKTLIPSLGEGPIISTFRNTHAYRKMTVYEHGAVNHIYEYMYEAIPHVAIETEELLGVKVAPNPAHGFVSVEGVGEEPATLRIFDVSGKVVQCCEVSAVSNVVDIRKLKPGCYVLRIDVRGNAFSTKLIIGDLQ